MAGKTWVLSIIHQPPPPIIASPTPTATMRGSHACLEKHGAICESPLGGHDLPTRPSHRRAIYQTIRALSPVVSTTFVQPGLKLSFAGRVFLSSRPVFSCGREPGPADFGRTEGWMIHRTAISLKGLHLHSSPGSPCKLQGGLIA